MFVCLLLPVIRWLLFGLGCSRSDVRLSFWVAYGLLRVANC